MKGKLRGTVIIVDIFPQGPTPFSCFNLQLPGLLTLRTHYFKTKYFDRYKPQGWMIAKIQKEQLVIYTSKMYTLKKVKKLKNCVYMLR